MVQAIYCINVEIWITGKLQIYECYRFNDRVLLFGDKLSLHGNHTKKVRCTF